MDRRSAGAGERRVVPERLSNRVQRWAAACGWSDPQAARLLGTSTSMFRKVRVGTRSPGRKLSLAIERLSATWDEGPIRASEWDVVDALRETSEESAA
jgi:hypothetical protein